MYKRANIFAFARAKQGNDNELLNILQRAISERAVSSLQFSPRSRSTLCWWGFVLLKRVRAGTSTKLVKAPRRRARRRARPPTRRERRRQRSIETPTKVFYPLKSVCVCIGNPQIFSHLQQLRMAPDSLPIGIQR